MSFDPGCRPAIVGRCLGIAVMTGLLAAACGEGTSRAPTDEFDQGDPTAGAAPPKRTVSDSAGTALIHYEALGGVDSWPRWSVSLADTARIGRLGQGQEDSSHVFGNPMQAVQVFGGSVAVADWQTQSIRLFDRRGDLLQSLGGRGDGPGEFRSLTGIIPLGPDSIAVPDASNGRLTVFGADGEVLSAQHVDIVRNDQFPTIIHIFSDGSLLLRQGLGSEVLSEEYSPDEAVTVGSTYLVVGTNQYVRVARWGTDVARFGPFPEKPNVQVPTGSFPPMDIFFISVGPIAEGVGEQFYWGNQDLSEVQVFHGSGRLQRVLRFSDTIAADRVPPLSTRLDQPDSTLSEKVRHELTEGRELLGVGSGPFSTMAIDDQGFIWLREQRSTEDEPSESAWWYVFDSLGDPAAMIRLPYWWGVEGWGLEIHEDVIIAREVDPLGRETYMRVPLDRGG